jgi:pyruvate dehydrogenase E2 component (dihydrolipoamide acetyltransferase)
MLNFEVGVTDRGDQWGAVAMSAVETTDGVRSKGPGAVVEIEMPRLGAEADGVEQGATLSSWLVAEGDEVSQGDVIAELETDKATVELESPATGRIAGVAVAEGTEGLLPGAVLGTLEQAQDLADADSARRSSTPEASDEPNSPERSDDLIHQAETRRATPLARRAATANAVDLGGLEGSGPGGRVVEADVLLAAGGEQALAPPEVSPSAEGEAGPTPLPPGEEAGFRVERLSTMRRTIARRLTESKQQIPHFYLRMRVPMDELIAARARLNAGAKEEGRALRISVNDFVLRATGLALRDVPAANVQFAEEGMRYFERVDVSVAVATEGGLVTPVVRDADRKGLLALAAEVQQLAAQAREGSLRPEQYRGGTITISNLGMYGVETVYPILNPPQACILGIGAAEEQPVVREGEITVGRVASITLAADHRAVDGAVGAELLAALRDRLVDPLSMML